MNSVNLLVFLLSCSFTSAAIANKFETRQSKVVGGHEAKAHSHPYLVSLQTRILWIRLHICGGALLNKNWVLSAGHCIAESWLIRWLPLDAIAGSHDVNHFDHFVQISTIDKRIPHPKYSGGIGPYDIAMLKTKTPFTLTKEIQPINLPVDYDLHRQPLTLAGWGALRTTTFIPDLPSKLQEVEVTFIPYKECYEALEDIKEEDEKNELDENAHLCTGPLTGGIAACSGDSGGPLIQYFTNYIEESDNQHKEGSNKVNDLSSKDDSSEYGTNIPVSSNYLKNNDENSRYPVVIGVVSWGISPCGEKGAPTVYTNVSQYLDFIYNHIYE